MFLVINTFLIVKLKFGVSLRFDMLSIISLHVVNFPTQLSNPPLPAIFMLSKTKCWLHSEVNWSIPDTVQRNVMRLCQPPLLTKEFLNKEVGVEKRVNMGHSNMQDIFDWPLEVLEKN